jgi:hypothetical protein
MENTKYKNNLTPSNVGSIFGVLTIVCPIMVLFHPIAGGAGLHFSIINLGFGFDYYFGQVEIWIYEPLAFLSELVFVFFRFVFAVQIVLLYQGRTTKRKTILAGVLGELPILILSISRDLVLLLQWLSGGISQSLMIPTPIILLLGLLLFKKYPSIDTIWDDRSKSCDWWIESSMEKVE